MSEQTSKMSLRGYAFDADGVDSPIEPGEINLSDIGERQLMWIMSGFDDTVDIAMPELSDGMRGVTTDRSLTAKTDGEIVSFALPIATGDDSNKTSIARFVIGRNWLMTFSDEPLKIFDEFLDQDMAEGRTGELTAAALASALVQMNFDDYGEWIERYDEEVDELDANILSATRYENPIGRIAESRRHIALIRKKISAHRSVIQALQRPDFLEIFGEDDRRHLSELSHSYERLEDDIARLRDALLGTFELYSTRMSEDTNRLVKVLTIITVVIGVVGMIAGIFGMNFDVPGLDEGAQSFYVVLGGMTAVSILILLIAWVRRWY